MGLGLSALFCEEVHRIALPSAREIHTKSAVISRIAKIVRYEHKLISCEYLRDSAHGRHHSHSQLHLRRVLSENISKTGGIVVAREDEHLRKIVIHEVVRENVIYPCHALAPAGIVFRESCAHRVMKREVHD